MALITHRDFVVKAVDFEGKRWQFTQAALSVAHAEQLAATVIGLTRYLFVRRPS
jgi:hypothetical protein